jgi:gamma-carbonic anhydrase
MIHPFGETRPTLGRDVLVAPGAHVIGDVVLGDQASVWFNTVVRGDVYYVRIGERTNLQDGTVVHVTTGKHATVVGADVTVGHRVLLHGCTIGHHALIGMGAIVMDRVEVGEYSIIGAGSLVTEGTVIPPGTLALGAPAKPRRDITDAERALLEALAGRYVQLAARYLAQSAG